MGVRVIFDDGEDDSEDNVDNDHDFVHINDLCSTSNHDTFAMKTLSAPCLFRSLRLVVWWLESDDDLSLS